MRYLAPDALFGLLQTIVESFLLLFREKFLEHVQYCYLRTKINNSF